MEDNNIRKKKKKKAKKKLIRTVRRSLCLRCLTYEKDYIAVRRMIIAQNVWSYCGTRPLIGGQLSVVRFFLFLFLLINFSSSAPRSLLMKNLPLIVEKRNTHSKSYDRQRTEEGTQSKRHGTISLPASAGPRQFAQTNYQCERIQCTTGSQCVQT